MNGSAKQQTSELCVGVVIEKYFMFCSRYKTCEEMRQQERELLTTNENCDSQEVKDSQTRTRCH